MEKYAMKTYIKYKMNLPIFFEISSNEKEASYNFKSN